MKEASDGRMMFNLKASNGEVIATSQLYKHKESCVKGMNSVAKNAAIAPIEDTTVEGYEAQKNPKFVISKDKAGEFRFKLQASNGQVIAVSQGYSAKANCINGIESVKKNAVL